MGSSIMTVAELLTLVGTSLTSVLGWLINVLTTALQSPIVVVFIIMAIIGTVIGFAKKLLHF